MKTSKRQGMPAFTLIELMAVITIIVILAGLVVGGLGFVSERQAKEKARVQIALLSKGLEDYKLENGSYPPTGNSGNNSSILFKYLYWDSNANNVGVPADTDQRIYLPELDPASSKQGWTTGTAGAATIISDPWGNEYRYRSAKDTAGKANSLTQNPDFDLWSTGKDSATKPETPSDKSNRDDIKNF